MQELQLRSALSAPTHDEGEGGAGGFELCPVRDGCGLLRGVGSLAGTQSGQKAFAGPAELLLWAGRVAEHQVAPYHCLLLTATLRSCHPARRLLTAHSSSAALCV